MITVLCMLLCSLVQCTTVLGLSVSHTACGKSHCEAHYVRLVYGMRGVQYENVHPNWGYAHIRGLYITPTTLSDGEGPRQRIPRRTRTLHGDAHEELGPHNGYANVAIRASVLGTQELNYAQYALDEGTCVSSITLDALRDTSGGDFYLYMYTSYSFDARSPVMTQASLVTVIQLEHNVMHAVTLCHAVPVYPSCRRTHNMFEECHNDGMCADDGKSCVCHDDWYGRFCTESKIDCSTIEGGGCPDSQVCTWDASRGRSTCKQMIYGLAQTAAPRCSGCMGTCMDVPTMGVALCVCPITNPTCDTVMARCGGEHKACLNGGECSGDTPQCTCPRGTFGYHCEIATNTGIDIEPAQESVLSALDGLVAQLVDSSLPSHTIGLYLHEAIDRLRKSVPVGEWVGLVLNTGTAAATDITNGDEVDTTTVQMTLLDMLVGLRSAVCYGSTRQVRVETV